MRRWMYVVGGMNLEQDVTWLALQVHVPIDSISIPTIWTYGHDNMRVELSFLVWFLAWCNTLMI